MRSTNLIMEHNLNFLLKNKLDELQILEDELHDCKSVVKGKMHMRDIVHAKIYSKTSEIIDILKSNYDKLS